MDPTDRRAPVNPAAAPPHTRGWTQRTLQVSRPVAGSPAHAGMDRFLQGFGNGRRRLPRTRGDGPFCRLRSGARVSAPPHTRGWTRTAFHMPIRRRGSPAHAGMDPKTSASHQWKRRLPRTRGDGPATHVHHAEPRRGSPAHAGMDRGQHRRQIARIGLPRTRGDGPQYRTRRPCVWPAPPHTRGWTQRIELGFERVAGSPAHAGMDPWPNTRGWTVEAVPRGTDGEGSPAHAGMDPRARATVLSANRLPRTRGDGPLVFPQPQLALQAPPHTRGWTRRCIETHVIAGGSPAHAGMDRTLSVDGAFATGLPRTRGDGPPVGLDASSPSEAPPHTRGWTLDDGTEITYRFGSPAHAGMDPCEIVSDPSAAWLPRTRGDGPFWSLEDATRREAPPHTRGWTPMVNAIGSPPRGSPAHAGMDPSSGSATIRRPRLPRTRGDGPRRKVAGSVAAPAPPHTRGWTLWRSEACFFSQGSPAHAGMDP